MDTTDYPIILEAATKFVLLCYGLNDCADINEARVRSWERKMSRNVLEPPKLRSLPPTKEAFYQNVLHVHFAAAVMKGSLQPDPPSLSPLDHGWYTMPDCEMLLPRVTADDTVMAPDALLKLVKCGCKSAEPCATKQCRCQKNHLKCTFLCHCRGCGECKNPFSC